MIVQIRKLSKSFGSKDLFNNLDLEIKPNDKLAIIGANGVGKTTLFKILQDEESFDSGQIFWKRNIRKGFLEQIHINDENIKLEKYFSSAYEDLQEMEEAPAFL